QHVEHTDMALNHLNLTVPDVPQTRAFFETYFGFRCVAQAPRSDALVVLVDESGFVLTLNNFAQAAAVVYPGAFHVGFRENSREQVDAIHQRLKADGFDMKPPHEFHGGWTFYFRAPGGFLVEVFHQPGVVRRGGGASLGQAAGAEEELAGQALAASPDHLPTTAAKADDSGGEKEPTFRPWGVRYQVKDVERSVTFYTRHLGFKLEQQAGSAFAKVSNGNLSLLLSGPKASGSRPMPDARKQEPGGWNRVVLAADDLPARVEE